MKQRSGAVVPEGEFLAIDYGFKRVGVARINSHAQIAEYLPVIQRENDDQVVQEIEDITNACGSHGIVVGLPRSLDGVDTNQTALTRTFIDTLAVRSSLPVYAIDEAGTTEEAKQRAGKSIAGIDSVAAGIIAEDFINQKDISVLRYSVGLK